MKNVWIGIDHARFVNLAHASLIEIPGTSHTDGVRYEVTAVMTSGERIVLRSFGSVTEAQTWVCDILNDEEA